MRGWMLAGLVTLLTATGHVAGGGTVEGLSTLAVLVPLMATALIALADRCRCVVAVLLTLGIGQAVLHLLLGVVTHDHHVGSVPGAAMIAAHSVATVVAAAATTHADAAVTALVTALRRVLPRRLRLAAVDVALPTRAVPSAEVPLRATLGLVAAHARRGPPVAC